MSADDAPPIAAPLGGATTDRLRLSRMRADDADALAPVFANRAVWEFPFGRGMDARLAATEMRDAVDVDLYWLTRDAWRADGGAATG